MKKFIYVTIDPNADKSSENLMAWTTLEATENGRVGVYELVEELDKREAVEVRRKGNKGWFKAAK